MHERNKFEIVSWIVTLPVLIYLVVSVLGCLPGMSEDGIRALFYEIERQFTSDMTVSVFTTLQLPFIIGNAAACIILCIVGIVRAIPCFITGKDMGNGALGVLASAVCSCFAMLTITQARDTFDFFYDWRFMTAFYVAAGIVVLNLFLAFVKRAKQFTPAKIVSAVLSLGLAACALFLTASVSGEVFYFEGDIYTVFTFIRYLTVNNDIAMVNSAAVIGTILFGIMCGVTVFASILMKRALISAADSKTSVMGLTNFVAIISLAMCLLAAWNPLSAGPAWGLIVTAVVLSIAAAIAVTQLHRKST